MARTSTEFTQAERNAFEAFFVKNHLVIDGAVGHKNGEILADFIANKMNSDITAETLAAAVKVVKGLVFKTAAQREFDTAISGMSEAEKSVVSKWLERQKQLVLDGDPGFENFSIIVGWLRARNYPISEQNLNMSLTNVINNSCQRSLHWKAAPAHEGGYGRHSGKKFDSKNEPEEERLYVGGRLNHSHNPGYAPKPKETSTSADEARWRQMAENLRANTHSRTAEIQKIMRPTWRETFEARNKALS
ncbi:MAG: hypothetical protein JWO71_2485 [Candidatus Acidoferrum typicum]|nr:hypothetical protein [Candidatus Acidoferrum typicum]